MGIRLAVRTKSSSDPNGESVALEFDQARVALGRGGGADVPLPHVSVSALHATIRTHNAGYAIFDESSTNGTKVAGAKLAPGRAKVLKTGDLIAIGPFRIEIQVGVPVTRGASVEDSIASARRLASASQEARRRRAPTLTIQNGARAGERVAVVAGSPLVLGSGSECELVLDDPSCAATHGRIEIDELGVVVREHGGEIFVNERPTTDRRLRDRDEIRLGNTVLVFDDPLETELEEIRASADAAYDDPDETPLPIPIPPSDALGPVRPASVADFSDTDGPPFSSPVPKAPVEATRSTAEGLVYGLAGAVLVLSFVAMYFLLRAG